MSMSVCLFVSVDPRAYLQNGISSLNRLFMHATYCRGSVLFLTALQYAMYFRFYG